MSRQGWIITVISVVLIAVFGGWLASLEWTEKTSDRRFTEQARKQPYLVAERFLQQWGVAFEKERGFSRLDRGNPERPMPGTEETLLLLNAYGQLSARRTENLLGWVERGGHLIVTAENPFLGVGGTVQAPLFEHFGVQVAQTDYGSTPAATLEPVCDDLEAPIAFTTKDDGPELEMTMLGDRVLQVAEDRRAHTVSDEWGTRLVQVEAGNGQVSFIASAAIWRNPYVGCNDHAFLLSELIPEQSMLRILHNLEGPSLWDTIRERANLAATALTLGVLLLLWYHGVRFGPVREGISERSRSVLEHVEAAAHFAWRHRRRERLLASVQQEVAALAAPVIPGYRAMAPEERHQALAQHAGLDEAAVARAMAETPTDENAFLAAMQTLKSLRESL